jgi:phage anti-repressor protein
MTDEQSTTTALIPVYERLIGNKKCLAVEARILHERLGVKKPFTQWLEQYTSKDDWRKDNDFSVFTLVVKNPEGGGRPGIDAALSLQMAEHIAMMTRTAQGRKIREYFRDARDQRDAAAMTDDPVERYPQLRAIRELVTATATAQWTAERAEERAQAAEVRAVRAETKADLALEDARYLAVEEFVMKNGLIHQYPESCWRSMSNWLKHFCEDYGLEIRKTSVYGKKWNDENTYPWQAFSAFLRYDRKRPHQISLVQDPSA